MRAAHRAPFLNGACIVYEKCRAGLYENTPDHHAILGACDVDGLYLACGFSGHGVMHSPATGRALAEIILDGEADRGGDLTAVDKLADQAIKDFSAGRCTEL